MHIYVYVHMYISACIEMYAYVRIYVHIYTYIFNVFAFRRFVRCTGLGRARACFLEGCWRAVGIVWELAKALRQVDSPMLLIIEILYDLTYTILQEILGFWYMRSCRISSSPVVLPMLLMEDVSGILKGLQQRHLSCESGDWFFY